MEATAKTVTQCDNCKISLKKEDDTLNENIQATLANGKQEHQTYHYCNEECLRQHLNGRAKRKRAMASLMPDTGVLALDVAEDVAYAAWKAKQAK
jgi:hypothetical protein